MVLVLGLATASARATEQAVTPIAPAVEQRVRPLDQAETQRVEIIDPALAQDVSESTPPSRAHEVASTTGKVAVGFMAVVLSIAVMAAQILFI
jgi:hypothetical protein